MHGENRGIPPINEEKTVKIICNFLKDRLRQSKTEGVVIGLSGGLDSSTTAYLCERAFGRDNILGLVMPSETTSKEDVNDAVKVAEALGIEYETVEVDDLISPFKNLCIHSGEGYNTALAGANLKARMRMTRIKYVGQIDEYSIIKDALEYLSGEVDAEVIVYDEPTYDPESKSKNASPYKPAIYMSLGTDGAASNNNLDLLEEMKLAALLQKVTTLDPTAMPAKSVFNMAIHRQDRQEHPGCCSGHCKGASH